ncbi:hypothetical protein CfE428DRAFT_5803 [Chthoniobacter flavus Ellin428]|uniref:Uncharacterized protein n=1 Tax=Chthoniobacter flavus Ellin428 TaxID=497964 RepID=B4DA63_9BACT|nr:hypothetical protein [Chthoniobacter flavus]EDY16690.1 hypothetical protein CfE428DRAFT_5803 [Chthoniobacter flavus Ellin428]TCO87263.1 hypothetical protein EV701_123100 [Chthoniobacter flavus]
MNWIAIIPDDLKASGHGTIIDKAQTLAVGGVDPVADAIANITAEVRSAVRTGNQLDTDPTKIPRSLKRLAVQMILFALMERIGVPLSDAQAKESDRHAKRLEQLYERKEVLEPPDSPDTTGSPVNPGMWNSENKLIMRTHPTPVPGVQFPPTGGYANPDAPQDPTS